MWGMQMCKGIEGDLLFQRATFTSLAGGQP